MLWGESRAMLGTKSVGAERKGVPASGGQASKSRGLSRPEEGGGSTEALGSVLQVRKH